MINFLTSLCSGKNERKKGSCPGRPLQKGAENSPREIKVLDLTACGDKPGSTERQSSQTNIHLDDINITSENKSSSETLTRIRHLFSGP